ncbi:hypothetical protein F5050DRAFT_1714885 [Lentinula boryana]|uniref:Uncharacterized protein n=1 Tax=Lentinula boryana TaxID=40481 RepID=A0ABQ8Q3G6_9AGAR|nr:hypothetical protein F5050DRAFT_1714885 [Lentinula boryana]
MRFRYSDHSSKRNYRRLQGEETIKVTKDFEEAKVCINSAVFELVRNVDNRIQTCMIPSLSSCFGFAKRFRYRNSSLSNLSTQSVMPRKVHSSLPSRRGDTFSAQREPSNDLHSSRQAPGIPPQTHSKKQARTRRELMDTVISNFEVTSLSVANGQSCRQFDNFCKVRAARLLLSQVPSQGRQCTSGIDDDTEDDRENDPEDFAYSTGHHPGSDDEEVLFCLHTPSKSRPLSPFDSA